MVWLNWNESKSSESFKQKVSKYCSTHINIKTYRTHKHTDIFYILGELKIVNCQFYNSVSLIKSGQQLQQQMTAIAVIWWLFPYIQKIRKGCLNYLCIFQVKHN